MHWSRRTWRWALALAAALAAAAPADAHAVDDPRLTWWTYETRHFRVHHPHTLDAPARRVAELCESIRERMIQEMGYAPDHPTEILLTDYVDTANGSATPVPYDAVRLFVSAPPDLSALGDYDDWLSMLITHEYVHILHTGNISGAAAVFNAVFGRTLAPNSANPRWLIEGLATLEESEHSSGGRVRGTLFDTFLRVDVLEDRVARLDQISGNPFRWPQGNVWYLYGSKLQRWVSDVYGPDTMPAVSADYGASLAPFGVSRAIRRVTGRTWDQLYDAWVEHLRLHYAEQVREVERRGLREGVQITARGGSAAYPRFVPVAARADPRAPELIYFRADQDERAGLHRLQLGATADRTPREERLVARTSGDAYATFEPDGDVLFHHADVHRNVYSRNDLYRLVRGSVSNEGGELSRERLTVGARAAEPDVSPDGRQVVYTVNSAGTSYLSIADVGADGRLGPRRTLVPSARFEQAYTPRFSPDGRFVAYSAWTAGGYRDVRVVEVDTGKFWQITRDRSLDLQPTWSPDGARLYFTSDRTGIFNVFVHDLGSGTTRQVTNVRGAALMPAVSDDERTLVYVGYRSTGFELFVMPLDPARFLDAPPPPDDRPAAPPEPRPVVTRHERYDPWPTFGPRSYTIGIAPGDYGPTAVTVSASASDITGQHVASVDLRVDPDAPEPTVSLGYGWRGGPVDLGIGISRAVRPRGGYVVGGQEVLYDETDLSVTPSISYPLSRAFVSQSVSLSYSASILSADLPFPVDVSPLSPITRRPPEGFLGTLRASYALSTAEGSRTAAGALRGSTLRVTASYAGEETGSDESLYGAEINASTYVPMPWPGFHVLALRGAGGIVDGTYARRGFYYVGGYDFASNDAFDAIGGALDGAFVLRGYAPSTYRGSGYVLSTAEYRFPIVQPDAGLSTLPLYLRRIDGAAFLDWGGAFDRFRFEDVELFHDGALVDAPDLHASVGGELWLGATLVHRADMLFRLGYAYGFSPEAIPDGQLYFLLSSAF